MQQSAVLAIFFIYHSVNFASSQFLYHDQKLYSGSACQTAEGRNGVCNANCATLTKAQLADRRNICGFDKNIPLLCCPRTAIDSASPYPTLLEACVDRKEKAEGRKEKAERSTLVEERNILESEYEDYLPRRNGEIRAQCEEEAGKIGGYEGKNYALWCYYLKLNLFYTSSSKVSPLVINEHPHVAALGWKSANGTIMWNCGGVLIHSSFVVSAAHCMFFFGKPDLVRVGDIHLFQSWDDKYAVNYDIEEVFSHPQYEPPKFYHSIALLKVKKREEFRSKRQPLPACIWTENSFPSRQLLSMGYGAPGFGHRHLARRFQSYLTVLPHSECTKLYDPIVDMPKGIIETQICALDEADILDTCVGDFGGPLQFNADDGLKTPYLIGITTFGAQCLDGNPGVYLRLYNYLDWIEKIIKENI